MKKILFLLLVSSLCSCNIDLSNRNLDRISSFDFVSRDGINQQTLSSDCSNYSDSEINDSGDSPQESSSEENGLNNNDKYLSVMTYNVGCWYGGSLDYVPEELQDFYYNLQYDSIRMFSPDLLFLQEYSVYLGEYDVRETILNEYWNYSFLEYDSYQGKCISSKQQLESYGINIFNQSDAVPRNYEKAHFLYKGKRICLISLHLATDLYIAESEINEILNEIENEEYFIICGDFNTDCNNTNDLGFKTIYKPFVDRGCNLANCSIFGFLETFIRNSKKKCIDNIITSNNISILSANTFALKIARNVPTSDIDHLPLIAYLEVV